MKFYSPDITIGYNIFGFDDEYIRNRIYLFFPYSEELKKLYNVISMLGFK